ncbi:ABC transporter permease [Tessaracoccus caeni]|uniref:ABC transporter permease n=1 Tax=Tessaracoccus caeni TaxID=3031239 RepID=UPI0023DB2BAF|nr:ABC transporter permease [Tessaracoccus caeni]MDF1489893.1 ABC transporter permease [Tessaracoccus caeni]
MRNVLGISGRNLTLFFRDPLNVFFSLMGALIIFVLYALFLGNLQMLSISAAVPGASEQLVRGFVDSWMLAAVVALSAMTTPLGALSVFVEDATTNRFRDFLVTPIRRGQLVLGYMGSAFVIAIFMTTIVFLVALGYLWILSGVVLGAAEIARSFLWIMLIAAGFTALWSFVASFLKTQGSFAALSTVVGTVAGFVAGAYLAVGLIPDAVRHVIAALPFAQSAMLLRREFTAAPLTELVDGDQELIDGLGEFYGVTLHVGGWAVPVWFAVGVLVALAVVFTVLAASRIRSRIR